MRNKMTMQTASEMYAKLLVKNGIVETPEQMINDLLSDIDNLRALLREARLENAKLTAMLDIVTLGKSA